jgi:hypothetical protein
LPELEVKVTNKSGYGLMDLPLNFSAASFPNSEELVRANMLVGTPSPTRMWIGGSHITNGGCNRHHHNGPWHWVSGEILPLCFPNWATFPHPGTEEPTFRNSCCLAMRTKGIPGAKKILLSDNCIVEYPFLCQY